MTTPKEMALQYLQSMGFSDADSGTHHGSAFRLKGFDAPETAKADGRPDEPFAVEAMTELERQIAASDGGTIEQVQDRDRVDVYGRKLSVLRGNDGRDINAAMAVSGFTHPRSDAHALAMQALTRTSFGDKFGSEQHAAARVLGDEATALRSSLPFQNDLKVRGQREENPFFPAVRRGTDQLHAMSYGALNALGGVLGNDWMERVGAEGVARNLKAAARNPAKIEAWDDVDSMDKFMTFVVEALGEQLPQLAGDAAAALLGGGVGGVMARRSVAKSLVREFGDEAYGRFLAGGGATLSERAMKRRMGEEGLKEFAADATGAKALNYAAQQGAKTGAKAAAFGSMYSQVAGETQLELQREGIDAPGTALLTGIPKAITEYSSLMFGIDRIAKAFHATPTSILDLVGKVAANAGLSGMVEGSEEGLQTLMDFTAVKLEKGENPLSLSPAEARELRTAIAKGALIGTALGGGGNTRRRWHGQGGPTGRGRHRSAR